MTSPELEVNVSQATSVAYINPVTLNKMTLIDLDSASQPPNDSAVSCSSSPLVIAPPQLLADHASSTINYSPKHSRKPSLLSTSRNINMKQLLLNFLSSSPSPSRDLSSSVASEAVYGPSIANGSLHVSPPLREPAKKPPALAIPHHQHASAPLVTPVVALTPLIPPAPPPQKTRGHSLRLLPVIPPSEFRLGLPPVPFAPGSPEIALLSPFALAHHQHTHNNASDSVFDEAPLLDRRQVHLHSHQDASGIQYYPPEELQEQSSLHAYPNGPARVLDNNLFLYLDPKHSSRPVDVNDYDLVINVAKDCTNLSEEFDTKNGKRTYLHVPWSHTSLILKDLPKITEMIARYDRPGLKTLVHCQCGVLRSACVVVAYFMVKFHISVNEAYELLKSGTANTAEPCNRRIAKLGHHVDACERICPNMSLIFELMDFDENRKELAS